MPKGNFIRSNSIMEDAHIMVIVTHKLRFIGVNIRNISQTRCLTFAPYAWRKCMKEVDFLIRFAI